MGCDCPPPPLVVQDTFVDGWQLKSQWTDSIACMFVSPELSWSCQKVHMAPQQESCASTCTSLPLQADDAVCHAEHKMGLIRPQPTVLHIFQVRTMLRPSPPLGPPNPCMISVVSCINRKHSQHSSRRIQPTICQLSWHQHCLALVMMAFSCRDPLGKFLFGGLGV